MPAKRPRLTLHLDERQDRDLIKHLEGCRTGQTRRAHLHVFILAALDDDEPVTLDLSALTEVPDNDYTIELLIPLSSPPRVREAYIQTIADLRAVTMRALIRYGFKRMHESRGPRISSLYAPLEHEAVGIREEGDDSGPQPGSQPSEDKRATVEDQTRPENSEQVERPSEGSSAPHAGRTDRQSEMDELDALDDHESESSNAQPEFDMNRLLGSLD